jgi:hypothetical protein
MSKVISVFLFVFFSFVLPALAEVDTAWVRTYPPPKKFNVSAGQSIAVDNSGNVCVAGLIGVRKGMVTNGDFVIIKYDPMGKELWVKQYNGPGDSVDIPWDISTDAHANIYVTGESWGVNSGRDFTTIKYDPNGRELWVRRYNSPENGLDVAKAIAVDNSGNVFVAGGTNAETQSKYYPIDFVSYTIIKYDKNGKELWVRIYKGKGFGGFGTGDMVLDRSGNLYVTIYVSNSEREDNGRWVTIKYNTAGEQVWIREYDAPGDGYDYPRSIVVDVLGNVYVTGAAERPRIGDDRMGHNYVTIKYDRDGNELWQAIYKGEFIGAGWYLAVDSLGNVYVTGQCSDGCDYLIIKYDPNGKELWRKKYNNKGEGYPHGGIALGTSGEVYITGSAGTGIYDSEGHKLATDPWEGLDMVVDAHGNAYLTGGVGEMDSPYSDVKLLTVKYVQISNRKQK